MHRGRDVTIEAGPGTIGTRVIWSATDVVGKWANRVASESSYPLPRRADAPAGVQRPRTLSERISGVMTSVIKREGRSQAPRDGAMARDDLVPVAAGVTANSLAHQPYESRADAERRDVATLVTLGGLAFNLDSMPATLRQQVEEELARNMTNYRRVALSQGRVSTLQPLQLHALLTLATVRTQQAIRSRFGRENNVNLEEIDARVIKDGEIDGEAFEQVVAHGAPELKSAAVATTVAAGMGVVAANEPDQAHAVHRWITQTSPRYEPAVDAALERSDGRPADRPALKLVRAEQHQDTAPSMSAPG